MSRQITATIQCDGNILAPSTDVRRITLYQDLFGSHEFEVLVPFDNVEGPGEAFFSQAHKKLLGKTITIEIVADNFHFNAGQRLSFKGLITSIEASKDNDYDGSIVVRGYSPDHLLTDDVKKRTFIKKSLGDIFNEILKDYPANIFKRNISPTNASAIPFAVQYNESNFTFLSRLAAEHGEWFFYDGESLILGEPANREVDFVADGEYHSFSFGMHLKPSKVRMYEYNYLSNKHFKSETSSQRVSGIQNHLYGKYALDQSEATFTGTSHLAAQYPIESPTDLDQEALLLRSNTIADLITFRGHSDNPTIQLGCVLTVRSCLS